MKTMESAYLHITPGPQQLDLPSGSLVTSARLSEGNRVEVFYQRPDWMDNKRYTYEVVIHGAEVNTSSEFITTLIDAYRIVHIYQIIEG